MRTGIAELPLHPGRAPAWLMQRMARLGAVVVESIIETAGHGELLLRLSDPFWFQALGCVLGFDWHSSGVTTTVTGALQKGLDDRRHELGISICGGKGRRSRRTPDQIRAACERTGLDPFPLLRASRLAAKVDSGAVQDGYQLYHHVFVLTSGGEWAVIQQGMSAETRLARRYHWLGVRVKEFGVEPHAAIACDGRGPTMDLTASASEASRTAMVELARMEPRHFEHEAGVMRKLRLPERHEVLLADVSSKHFASIRLKTFEAAPDRFDDLLEVQGVGPATLRALALLGQVIFGARPCFDDPARFSFAHGGKDGYPYPVNRAGYDRTIAFLETAVARAKVGEPQRLEALRRLDAFVRQDRSSQPDRPVRMLHTPHPDVRGVSRDRQIELPF
jgi:hypothetical protein